MQFLEAEVAKVQLGEAKAAGSIISLLAEAGTAADTEYFGVCELPVFNPAAEQDCRRLGESVFAALRRSYKYGSGKHSFESALGEINLGLARARSESKLAGFVEKINACVAVRIADVLDISITGNISALLFREGEWMEVAESGIRGEGDKIFTSFSRGKVKNNDFLILSTEVLFEAISRERLGKLLEDRPLPEAGRELIKILEEVGSSGSAFGVLLIKFSAQSAEILNSGSKKIALENLSESDVSSGPLRGFLTQITTHTKTLFSKSKSMAANWSPRAKEAGLQAVKLGGSGARLAGSRARTIGKAARQGLGRVPGKTRAYVGVSLGVAVVLLGLFLWRQNIGEEKMKTEARIEAELAEAEKFLNEAETRQIYGDEAGARASLKEAGSLLSLAGGDVWQDKKSALLGQLSEISNKLEKNLPVEVEKLASLSLSSRMIVLPGTIATNSDGSRVLYDLESRQAREQSTEIENFVAGAPVSDEQYLIYNGDSLQIWKNLVSAPQAGPEFFQQLPKLSDFGGLAFYSVSNKAYVVDNSKRAILSFEVAGNSAAKPKAWNSQSIPENVRDIAVDGSIYLLGQSGLKKFHQGKEVGFAVAAGLDLTGAIRVLASGTLKYLYILDKPNARIVVLDKQGGLKGILKHDTLSEAADLAAFEKDQELYILAGGSLFKFTWTEP